MKKLLVAAAVLSLGLATANAQEQVKAAWVYVGPIGDFGWSYQHNQGRLAVEEALGDKVKTSYVENVSEGPDAERVIRQLAADGNDIIFTTSFGFMNPTAKVAAMFPDKKFEHATGYKRSDNLGTYSARFYEGRYVIGKIAGRVSENGIIGYIGSFPIPEVVRGINAFKLGLESVRPSAQIKVIWVNSWFDPGKEADAAKALIDQGVDILVQHTDSPAAMQVAEQRGIHAFGQASDMIQFGPTAQLTAIVDDWSVYYTNRVKAVLDDTWAADDTWGGFSAEMVKMAPYTNMPDDVAAEARETEEAIRSGELNPFAGPIYKQNGDLAVAEGEALTDEQLLGMNWYVKGIEDKLPE
ncbi:BMP family ABC transporter substrate-binding protein [Microbaculum marinum]|uniref:BMP family ABC transporter substrate-binding protein n=1 Tax=Microbaculum marinum TaxID=1764581 RepID=A0AAW9S0S7_9HYPH